MMKLKGLFTNFEYMAFFSCPPKETKEAKLICMQKKTQNLTSILRLSTILTQWAYGFIGKKNSWTHLRSGLSLKKIEVHNNTIIKAQLICTQRTKNLAQVHRLTIADCNKTHLNQIIVEKQQICV